MEKAALFVGWGPAVAGEERAAAAALAALRDLLEARRAAGVLQAVELALLEPHAGELGGLALLTAEKERLARLREEEPFLAALVDVQLSHGHVNVAWAYDGAALVRLLSVFEPPRLQARRAG